MQFAFFYETYKIPHEQVMHTIELLGRHVIPAFR